MLSVDSTGDSTLFTLDWDNHGELDHEDRQALLNLLIQGQTQDANPPEPNLAPQQGNPAWWSPAATQARNQAPPRKTSREVSRKASPVGVSQED